MFNPNANVLVQVPKQPEKGETRVIVWTSGVYRCIHELSFSSQSPVCNPLAGGRYCLSFSGKALHYSCCLQLCFAGRMLCAGSQSLAPQVKPFILHVAATILSFFSCICRCAFWWGACHSFMLLSLTGLSFMQLSEVRASSFLSSETVLLLLQLHFQRSWCKAFQAVCQR